MLSKKNRLPRRTRLKEDSEISSRLFLVKTQSNLEGVSRFGFIVSKNVSRTAVGRNKIRRIFRYCVERNKGRIKRGLDFLIIARRESTKADSQQIFLEFNKIFKENNLMK